MSRSAFVSLAVAALALIPSAAHAVWDPDSVLTLGQGGNIPFEWGAILPLGGGDLYAIWHSPSSSGVESKVSRVTREGVVVFSIEEESRTRQQGIAADGLDGVIDAFSNAFRRTTPAGETLPPFGAGSYEAVLFAPGLGSPTAATDPQGGAYLAWGSQPPTLQRVTAAGTIAPGWSSRGRKVGPYWNGPFALPALVPDGSGGVYLLAVEDSMRVWRVRSDTTLATGWPDTGVPLGPVVQYFGFDFDPGLVAGPPGHAFAAWIEWVGSPPTTARVAARSFDDAGNPDGPVLGLGSFHSDISKLAAQGDGLGGMLLTWLRAGTLQIARVFANGTVAAGPLSVASGINGQAVSPGRNGGFVVFWGDATGLWVKWFLAGGVPDPDEPVNPRLLRAHGVSTLGVYPLAAYPDGDGGAFVLFGNGGNPGPTRAQMMHVIPAVSTATVLARFDATTTADGVELRWSFGEPGRVASVAVERAQSATGPWESITPELRFESGATVALDRTVDGSGDYYYRLVVQLTDGGQTSFGPISARRTELLTKSALTFMSPNPTSGGIQLQYEIARAGPIRLELLDVSGRVVVTLADRIQEPGRYLADWDGAGPRGRIAPGLYFVRLLAPDRAAVRKLAIIR